MDAQEYDEMLKRIMVLTVTLGASIDRQDARMDQHEARMARYDDMIDRQNAMLVELQEFNRQQVRINQRLEETQAGIKALLDRMLPPSENGREV